MVGSVAQAQTATIQQQIAVAVVAKRLDAVESQGRAAVELIKAAQQLSKAVGRGQRFDAVA